MIRSTGPSPWRLAIPVLCLLGIAWFALPPAALADPDEVTVIRIDLRDKQTDLKLLNEMGVDIDAVFDGWARAYVPAKNVAKLQGLGFEVRELPNEGKIGLARLELEGIASGVAPLDVPTQYHTYATLTADLQSIAATNPDIARLISIGQTVQGREMWMMKISDNPDVEEDEPEVAYIGGIHGDEVVGKEMCFNLINHLTAAYGNDSRVTDLVNDTEIWIMPSMNPDGTQAGGRYNAHGEDLNRNFPDWFADPVNTPEGREPETAVMMAWTVARNIVLSAVFHGGELVINYPWDNNPSGSSVPSPTDDPDDALLISVSESYAIHNSPMWNSSEFYHGVTNGADWYAITGGIQDWSYAWYGNFLVTAEIGDNKWPPAGQLPSYWDDNFESMMAYFERVHGGVRGVVTDAVNGAPVAATVHIDANPFPVYTDPDVGDYYRLVLPGSYTITVSAPGYATQVLPVQVFSGPASRYDVALMPLETELRQVSASVDDGVGGDEWLDPGETAALAVTLENLGQAATGVGARLVPTGWFAEILQDTASYPDIPTGQHVESTAPHYQVRVAPDTPVAHKIGFVLEWDSDQKSGTSEPFYLEAGGPFCQSTAATDLPQPIQDNQTTTSQIEVTSATTVSEAFVTVDILHTYIGDLWVDLTSPANTTVRLHNRTGGSAKNILGTYGVNLTPHEDLSVLIGEAAGGTWQLDVTDNAGADTGVLNAWGLELCEQVVEASTPEMRLRDLSLVPGGVLIRWWPYPGMDSFRVYRSTTASPASAFLDVTAEDGDATDTSFTDPSVDPLVFYLVTGVGPQGEGPKGHFGE